MLTHSIDGKTAQRACVQDATHPQKWIPFLLDSRVIAGMGLPGLTVPSSLLQPGLRQRNMFRIDVCNSSLISREGVWPWPYFSLSAFWVVGGGWTVNLEDGSHLFKMVEPCQPGCLKACVKTSLLLKLETFSHCLAFFIAFAFLIQGLFLFPSVQIYQQTFIEH